MTADQAKTESLAAVASIDGWLTDREAGLLFDLAAQAAGPIIEIGSWRGRSTAALALGSMAGNRQPVYAIDNFVGVSGYDTPTPETLRANLDRVGVNGLVRIVAEPSEQAAEKLPGCGLLFVDGCHDYAAVCRDLELYLPKVATGGAIVAHDYWPGANEVEGVKRAIDERIVADASTWRPRPRIDSAFVAVRQTRHRILLALPGTSLCWGTAKAILRMGASQHEVFPMNSGTGWDDFNGLWANGLNAAAAGEVTHFAMLHSDIAPVGDWLDALVDELDAGGFDLVSTVSPIKDGRGLTSSGIGDPADPWCPFRRFTVREILGMPEVFTAAQIGHGERYLLHNSGCWVCDLRSGLFSRTDEAGDLIAHFDFPRRVRRDASGKLVNEHESEDWFFSRKIAQLGAKTAITRKVRLTHRGPIELPNDEPWGTYLHDDDTKHKWGAAT